MGETVPEVRRGSRTDPISAGALLDPDDGKVLCAADGYVEWLR